MVLSPFTSPATSPGIVCCIGRWHIDQTDISNVMSVPLDDIPLYLARMSSDRTTVPIGITHYGAWYCREALAPFFLYRLEHDF